ncbi:MAG: hypothetical protein IJE50_04760 [Clostridia bacterium]|nr:hypothetical protein [Clostridia bacterium]MBQ2914815.1 hypothetical protein [Clostridia bacterium]
MDDWNKRLLEISEKIGQMMLSINDAVTKFTASETFSNLIDFLSSIPKDIQETDLYRSILRLEKAEVTYDTVEGFQELIGYVSYDMCVNDLTSVEDKTELDKYILSIISSENFMSREKLVILLAHFEELIYQTISHTRKSNDKLKVIASNSTKNMQGMNFDNYRKLIICGIIFIVFSNTDKYDSEIDKRIPFRNNILHRGTLSYTDDEVKNAYELLVYFILELNIIAKKQKTRK